MSFDVNAHAADLLAEFEDRLENEEESDRRASVAGRVVLARRHGKLTFLVIRDRTGDLQLFCEEATLGVGYGLLEEIDLGDIVGASGHVVRDAAGRAVPQGGFAHHADEGAPSAPGEMAWPARPGSPAAAALPAPHHRPDGPRVRRGARHRAADDPPRARRPGVHRGGDACPAGRGRRGAGQAVHDAPQRARYRPQAADLAGAVPQALAGGRPGAHLRDRPELPQRGHRPRAQPGIHHARAVRGVRRLRDDDADRRRPYPRERAGGARVARPSRSASGSWTSRRPSAGSRCSGPSRRSTGEEVDARSHATSRSSRIATAFPSIPAWGAGKIVLEMFEKLVEHTFFEPTFVCDFPREVSPLARPHRERSGAHRALRRHRRRDRARHGVLRADRPDRAAGEVRGTDGGSVWPATRRPIRWTRTS